MQMLGMVWVAGAEHGLEWSAGSTAHLAEEGRGLFRGGRFDSDRRAVGEREGGYVERIAESMFGEFLRAVARTADITGSLGDGLQRLAEYLFGGRRDDVLSETGSGLGSCAVHFGIRLEPDILAKRFHNQWIGDRTAGRVGFGGLIVELHAEVVQALPAGNLFRREFAGWIGP